MSSALRLLQLALLAVSGLALASLVYALVSAPSMPVERLGLRGYKRTQALRKNESFAQVEPIMRWLSTRIGGLISPRLRQHVNHQITLAGVHGSRLLHDVDAAVRVYLPPLLPAD
jgi:hypothetical protein